MALQAGDKIVQETEAYAVSLTNGNMLAGRLFDEYWQAARWQEHNGGRVWRAHVVIELVEELK